MDRGIPTISGAEDHDMKHTLVFEDGQGRQVLLEVTGRTATIALRPEPGATWGPPLLPVLVDGSKPDADRTDQWSHDIPKDTP